jgi:hypothetical protein
MCSSEGSVKMAKRNRGMTEKKLEKWLKEGRGTGIGSEYKPWLTVQDVPSTGRATRLRAIKTGRQHELLSDMERDFFYIVEYADQVKDIREQYPLLPIEQTLLIADELGIKHPTDPKTQVPIVMTTDFLLTVGREDNQQLLARTIKSKDDLMNERQIEKFEIERRYWASKDIDWGVVTEVELYETTFAKNISIFHSFYNIDEIELDGITSHQKMKLLQSFKDMVLGKGVVVRDIATLFDERMMLPQGTGITFFKHLVMTKQIELDLYSKFDIDRPQNICLFTEIYDIGADVV